VSRVAWAVHSLGVNSSWAPSHGAATGPVAVTQPVRFWECTYRLQPVIFVVVSCQPGASPVLCRYTPLLPAMCAGMAIPRVPRPARLALSHVYKLSGPDIHLAHPAGLRHCREITSPRNALSRAVTKLPQRRLGQLTTFTPPTSRGSGASMAGSQERGLSKPQAVPCRHRGGAVYRGGCARRAGEQGALF
jgi:hypothetical protein